MIIATILERGEATSAREHRADLCLGNPGLPRDAGFPREGPGLGGIFYRRTMPLFWSTREGLERERGRRPHDTWGSRCERLLRVSGWLARADHGRGGRVLDRVRDGTGLGGGPCGIGDHWIWSPVGQGVKDGGHP